MTTTVVAAGPHRVSRSADVRAPAAALFAVVADPRRHRELDGSGTVVDTVSGPDRLSSGARFSVRMRQYGVPYRITSRVTDFEEGRLIEWRHPAGHRWRWELVARSDDSTRVTETFDYSRVAGGTATIRVYELLGVPRINARGIEKTLEQLQDRHPT